METATDSSGLEVTQLTAINVAKIVTILCLITLALIYGVNDCSLLRYILRHASCLLPQNEQFCTSSSARTAICVCFVGYAGQYINTK